MSDALPITTPTVFIGLPSSLVVPASPPDATSGHSALWTGAGSPSGSGANVRAGPVRSGRRLGCTSGRPVRSWARPPGAGRRGCHRDTGSLTGQSAGRRCSRRSPAMHRDGVVTAVVGGLFPRGPAVHELEPGRRAERVVALQGELAPDLEARPRRGHRARRSGPGSRPRPPRCRARGRSSRSRPPRRGRNASSGSSVAREVAEDPLQLRRLGPGGVEHGRLDVDARRCRSRAGPARWRRGPCRSRRRGPWPEARRGGRPPGRPRHGGRAPRPRTGRSGRRTRHREEARSRTVLARWVPTSGPMPWRHARHQRCRARRPATPRHARGAACASAWGSR